MNYASVVGNVPEELRPIFDEPLPDWSILEHYPDTRVVKAEYPTQEEFKDDLVETGLDPSYSRLFQVVAGIGALSVDPKTYFKIDIVQGPSRVVGRGLVWHTDEDIHRGRLVLSNRFGTLYLAESGVQTTPDFGILKLDGTNKHAPNKVDPEAIKTRLMITRMAIPESTTTL